MNRDPQGTPGVRVTRAAHVVHLSPRRIREYMRRGLVPLGAAYGGVMLLDEAQLARLRQIRRLTEDLGLNVAGVEVALRLLKRIETLQATRERSLQAISRRHSNN